MKSNWIALLFFTVSNYVFSATPLVEWLATPNPTQYLQPTGTITIFYSLRNNTAQRFPLTYILNHTNAVVIHPNATNDCGSYINAKSTCTVSIQYHAPDRNQLQTLLVLVDFKGRAPLSHKVLFTINNSINCSLLPIASYQSSFCQQQYQQVIQTTQHVFNPTNTQVLPEQSLGGMVGIYNNHQNQEQICYISCGRSQLNGSSPNEKTLFELASVSKTFTTSILGTFLFNHTLSSANLPVSTYLPDGFDLNSNEQQVTFQQLATFSGGICFSDSPSVNLQSNDPILNQNRFIEDINNINPDPSSGLCSNGAANTKPVYPNQGFIPSRNFYSNSSVGLLGQALMHMEQFNVFESGFNNWICKYITNPLNMNYTSGCLPEEAHNGSCASQAPLCAGTNWINGDYASGYHISANQFRLGNPFPYVPWAAAGAIRSNAIDMVQFIRANLGFTTDQSLSQMELIAGMAIAQQGTDYLPASNNIIPNIGSQQPVRGPQGFAWVCENKNREQICVKIGGHENFRSFLGLNKSQNYGIILLFNTGSNSTTGGFAPTSVPSISEIGASLLEHVT